MKKHLFTLCFVFASLAGYSQLKVKGSPEDGNIGFDTQPSDNAFATDQIDVTIEFCFLPGQNTGHLTQNFDLSFNSDALGGNPSIAIANFTLSETTQSADGTMCYYYTAEVDFEFSNLCDLGVVETTSNNPFILSYPIVTEFRIDCSRTLGRRSSSEDIQISPNPFLEYLVVNNVKEGDQLTISNILGQIVKRQEVTTNEGVNLSTNNIKVGMYNISIQRKGKIVYSRLFVKQ